MRAHEVLLERSHVGRGDARLAESAEARVHTVDVRSCIAGVRDRVDRRARPLHLRARLFGERDRAAADRDVLEIGEREGEADADGRGRGHDGPL
jgi:hypothetical protein